MNEASANTSAEPIDIVLPAHNEGDGIAQTIKEFDEIVRVKAGIPIRFVVCEDGSTDNTVEVLTRLSSEHPIHLVSSTNRKGYSRAVVDGLNESTSEIVGFIDSDGQCDPTDFPVLHAAIPDFDLVVGYRNPRKDALYRKAMSQSFKLAYQQLFPVRLPRSIVPLSSCPSPQPRTDSSRTSWVAPPRLLVGVQCTGAKCGTPSH